MEAKTYHDEMEALDTETVSPPLLTTLTNGGSLPKWTTDPRGSIFPFKTIYAVDAVFSCLLASDPRFVVSRELMWSYLRASLVTEVFERSINVKANLGDHALYLKQQQVAGKPLPNKRGRKEDYGRDLKDAPPKKIHSFTSCKDCKREVPKRINGGKSWSEYCAACRQKHGRSGSDDESEDSSSDDDSEDSRSDDESDDSGSDDTSEAPSLDDE